MSKQNKILETFPFRFKVFIPFYHNWSIDNHKITYLDLIYHPDKIIKYVEECCEDNDYFDDIPPPSKKQQIKNKLFQVINLLKREKQKEKIYSEDGIDRINNAIKIYLNYMYPNNSLKNDVCLIIDK